MPRATKMADKLTDNRAPPRRDCRRTTQQTRAISIMEMPITFSTSTLSRSVAGDQGSPLTYSCTRNSNPKPRISAPRFSVVRPISSAEVDRCQSLSVTSANEIPAKKRNSGAGRVPPSCDHMKKVVFREPALSHES